MLKMMCKIYSILFILLALGVGGVFCSEEAPSEHLSNCSDFPLYYFTLCGDADRIKEIDRALLQEINTIHTPHGTLLHSAAAAGHLEVARLLVELGISVHARRDFTQHTPLHDAVEQGHLDIARFLIEKGADVNARGFHFVPLDLAKNTKMADYLISCGAKIDARSPGEFNGKVCLHRAAFAGNLELIEVLLKHKANVNVKDDWGATPLYYAIAGVNDGVVAYLLQHGADAHVVTHTGVSLLDRIVGTFCDQILKNTNLASSNRQKCLNIAKLLIKADQPKRNQRSLLFMPNVLNCLVFLGFLSDAGWDINIKNEKGESLLDVGLKQSKSLEAIMFLINHDVEVTDSNQRHLAEKYPGYNWRIERAFFDEQRKANLLEFLLGYLKKLEPPVKARESAAVLSEEVCQFIYETDTCCICLEDIRPLHTNDIKCICSDSPSHVVCKSCFRIMVERRATTCPLSRALIH